MQDFWKGSEIFLYEENIENKEERDVKKLLSKLENE